MSVNLSHRVRLRPPWPLRYPLKMSSFNAKQTVVLFCVMESKFVCFYAK